MGLKKQRQHDDDDDDACCCDYQEEERRQQESDNKKVDKETTTLEKELSFPAWLERNAQHWRLYDFFLMVLTFGLGFVPLLLAKLIYGAGDFQWAEIASMGMSFVLIAPFWIMMWYWHPSTLHKVKNYAPRTVDICVTMYKEDLSVVRCTLVACQNISCDPAFLTLYALDDGRRPEVAQICDEINSHPDCKHPIIYVKRDDNKGQKGGNLNNWINVYSATASEFFLILDTDMQPDSDIVDAFMGHYFGFPQEEQESIAFIQAPQHFCNHNKKYDAFDVGISFFYKTLLPCMDALGVVMYIGTCGLWRREALVSSGGFFENHATEDSVTGCKVHRSCSKDGKQWISKFLRRPVATGISPANLPDLFDQRMRWVLGSIEMTVEHKWYLFADELSWGQRWAYFAACGYWLTGAISFLIQIGETVAVLTYIAYKGNDAADTVPFYCAMLPVIAFLLYFALLPMSSAAEKIAGMQMFFCYTPVFFIAMLKYMGLPIKVQATAVDNANDEKRWHPLFGWHITIIFLVTTGSAVALFYCQKSAIYLLVIIFHVVFWVAFYFPVLLSVAGLAAEKTFHWYYEIVEL